MCSNSRQASGGMPVYRGKCHKLVETLWTRTDCGSDTAVLLRPQIIGLDPSTDVDRKFQDPHIGNVGIFRRTCMMTHVCFDYL